MIPSTSDVRGIGPKRALQPLVVQVGGDRKLPVTVSDECSCRRHGLAERTHEPLDRLDRSPQVKSVGAFERLGQGPNERRGDVGHVLKVLRAAVADVIRPAHRQPT